MKNNDLVGEDYLRAILDAFPSPVLIVDKDLIIHDANAAAKQHFGGDISVKLKRLCGNMMKCMHALTASGSCGKTKYCSDCVVLQTAKTVLKGDRSFSRIANMTLEQDGKFQELCFLVSGAPLPYAGKNLVILTLEDITELTELRRIVPICSYCRKVRDDSDYWQQVEDYFLKYSHLRFSHGICPHCSKKHYTDL